MTPGADAAVKIRAGLMDIKVLEAVGEDGLEQWRPAMKATFPLPWSEAGRVCATLGVGAPSPGADAFTLDEFLAMLASSGRGVRAEAVHKRRRHYTLGGCMTEVTDVIAEDRQARTLAIESEDAGRVVALVRELGLSGRANTSYPRWLKATAGMEG